MQRGQREKIIVGLSKFTCVHRIIKVNGTFTLSGASMYDAIDSNAGNYVRVA